MRRFIYWASALALSLTLIVAAHAANPATVEAASGLRMRTAASYSAETIIIAPKGAEVTVIDRQDEWCRVYYEGERKFGFMATEYLNISDDDFELEIDGTVSGSLVNLRSSASTSSTVLRQLSKGTGVTITGVSGDWYSVVYGESVGFMSAEYVTPTAAGGKAASADSSALPETPSEISQLRRDLIDYAKQYLGTPYKSGGRSPSGFDCSGFVYYVFKNFGFTLNPGASNQMDSVNLIKKSEMLPGDVVFFNNGSGRRASHVGIYIGNGEFIHATSPGKPLAIDSLTSGYYYKYYVGVGRVLPIE